MPINRGPFNALVDDDGSNTIGTPWNKQAIKDVLLDPMDLALPVWQVQPFNAAHYSGSGGMVWTVGAAAVLVSRYAIINGRILVWYFYVSWFSGGNALSGTPSTSITITLPGGLIGFAGPQIETIDFCAGVAGVPQGAGLNASPQGGQLSISKTNSQNFAVTDIPGLVATVVLEIA
jgi:hypothetical protein